ncbi:aryl-sulfate sulfotransferase [Desulfovibrio aminophilus]|nr:aryl-sulfate sulfotransferase [Desulfovibrio aminophilus]MCM0754657.1 aryl-sulfate sulfotransferase [Desulfovibrio aminophilus]
MLTAVIAIALAAALLALARPASAYEIHRGPTGVITYDEQAAAKGYILLSPTVKCNVTYLINREGDVVHQWNCAYPPGLYATFLPNGHLLRGAALPEPPVKIGGAAGMVQELDWDGNVLWEYKMFSPDEIQHHCFDRMPNGNTLILGWERKTKQEALDKGRIPDTYPEVTVLQGVPMRDFWSDFVREVDPQGRTVWEWRVWDHIGAGPDQFDINYRLPLNVGEDYASFDWTHFNTVEYLPATDQILLNSRNFSEVYILDHKSGEIVRRWGNPSAYGQGRKPGWYDSGDQRIFGSHHAHMLENGHVTIFDNGSERPEGTRSRVVEVNLENGEVVWEYAAHGRNSFFSYRQGAAQRLENGNTLVTSTQQGHLFEVTPEGKVVWEFVNPIMCGEGKALFCDAADYLEPLGHDMFTNMVHRAYFYTPDHPALAGRDLSRKRPLVDGAPKFFRLWPGAA